jgi:hypothetical protein
VPNTVIQLKANTTSGVAPTAGQLAQGELALNAGDGKLFSKMANGTVIELNSGVNTVASITFIIDGGGNTITTGVKGFLEIPFGCTINRATALADQSGSIVVDVWKDTYANYPPTDADSITASAPITISAATKSQDSTLTGWTTAITAGDILGFNVDSVTTVQRLTVALRIVRTA